MLRGNGFWGGGGIRGGNVAWQTRRLPSKGPAAGYADGRNGHSFPDFQWRLECSLTGGSTASQVCRDGGRDHFRKWQAALYRRNRRPPIRAGSLRHPDSTWREFTRAFRSQFL